MSLLVRINLAFGGVFVVASGVEDLIEQLAAEIDAETDRRQFA
jgi:hypothetical protein